MASGIPPTNEPLLPGSLVDFRGIHEIVAKELRRRIVSGEYPPGTVLLQRRLADALGVSREPVRHALAVLETEGLIVSKPRRPAIVTPISIPLIHDVYEVRAELDALVARTAAARPDARGELAASLEPLFERVSSSRTDSDADQDFHRAIYAAANNSVALEFFDSRWAVFGRLMALISVSGYHDIAWQEHRLITDAIRDGEPDRAGELSRSHALSAGDWLIEHASELGNWIGDQPRDLPVTTDVQMGTDGGRASTP